MISAQINLQLYSEVPRKDIRDNANGANVTTELELAVWNRYVRTKVCYYYITTILMHHFIFSGKCYNAALS
jgi:hypothetical protein